MRATATPPRPLRLLLLLLAVTAAAAATTEGQGAPDTGSTEGPEAQTPLSSQVSQPKSPRDSTDTSTRGTPRGLFAPRVEYDEWTPLGHGDPLKNDPTYDYVPPVLERVRYWIEPPSRSPEPVLRQQTQIQSQTRTQTQTQTHTKPYHHNPTTYISTHPHQRHPPPQSTLQYVTNNADARRDAYPFLTLVDGPKFNLPQSSPYKPHSTPQLYQQQQQQQQQQQYQLVPRPPSHFSRPSVPYRTQPPLPAARPMTTPTLPPTQAPTSWLDLSMQQQQQQHQQKQQEHQQKQHQKQQEQMQQHQHQLQQQQLHQQQLKIQEQQSQQQQEQQLQLQQIEITRQPIVLLTPATATSTVAPPVTYPPSSAFTNNPSALTTDPLFAHYKQPSEPLQGPMYLIIEGHSKVKTYGASKTIHGIPVDSNLTIRRQKQRRRRRRKLRKRSAL